jgi:hypothetical protein
MLDECCAFEFDRRGKMIDCAPSAQAGCREDAQSTVQVSILGNDPALTSSLCKRQTQK